MVTSGKSANETQGIYDAEIERLIELAIIDGQISENERQVLLRKAQSKWIDLDEFNMVLDARLSEFNQSHVKKKPTSIKFGDVKKCPNCGAEVKSFQTKCEQCGFEFHNVEAVSSAQKLFDLLQEVECKKSEKIAELNKDEKNKPFFKKLLDNNWNYEVEEPDSMDSGLLGKFTDTLFGKWDDNTGSSKTRTTVTRSNEKDPIVKVEKQAEEEYISIVKSFPVPNANEDLLELLAMATSNAYDNDGVIGAREEAWLQKSDQIYQKIIVYAGNDTSLLEKATYMISSLMKRLPQGRYKNFTTIPKKMLAMYEEVTVVNTEPGTITPSDSKHDFKDTSITQRNKEKKDTISHSKEKSNKHSLEKKYTKRDLNYIIERLDYQNNLKFEEEMLIRDQVARVKKFRRRKIAYIVFGFMFFPLWLFAIIANYREKKAIEKLDKYCNLLR